MPETTYEEWERQFGGQPEAAPSPMAGAPSSTEVIPFEAWERSFSGERMSPYAPETPPEPDEPSILQVPELGLAKRLTGSESMTVDEARSFMQDIDLAMKIAPRWQRKQIAWQAQKDSIGERSPLGRARTDFPGIQELLKAIRGQEFDRKGAMEAIEFAKTVAPDWSDDQAEMAQMQEVMQERVAEARYADQPFAAKAIGTLGTLLGSPVEGASFGHAKPAEILPGLSEVGGQVQQTVGGLLDRLTGGAAGTSDIGTAPFLSPDQRASAEAATRGSIERNGVLGMAHSFGTLVGAAGPIGGIARSVGSAAKFLKVPPAVAERIGTPVALAVYNVLHADRQAPAAEAALEGAAFGLLAPAAASRLRGWLSKNPSLSREVVAEAMAWTLTDLAVKLPQGKQVTWEDLTHSAILGGLMGFQQGPRVKAEAESLARSRARDMEGLGNVKAREIGPSGEPRWVEDLQAYAKQAQEAFDKGEPPPGPEGFTNVRRTEPGKPAEAPQAASEAIDLPEPPVKPAETPEAVRRAVERPEVRIGVDDVAAEAAARALMTDKPIPKAKPMGPEAGAVDPLAIAGAAGKAVGKTIQAPFKGTLLGVQAVTGAGDAAVKAVARKVVEAVPGVKPTLEAIKDAAEVVRSTVPGSWTKEFLARRADREGTRALAKLRQKNALEDFKVHPDTGQPFTRGENEIGVRWLTGEATDAEAASALGLSTMKRLAKWRAVIDENHDYLAKRGRFNSETASEFEGVYLTRAFSKIEEAKGEGAGTVRTRGARLPEMIRRKSRWDVEYEKVGPDGGVTKERTSFRTKEGYELWREVMEAGSKENLANREAQIARLEADLKNLTNDRPTNRDVEGVDWRTRKTGQGEVYTVLWTTRGAEGKRVAQSKPFVSEPAARKFYDRLTDQQAETALMRDEAAAIRQGIDLLRKGKNTIQAQGFEIPADHFKITKVTPPLTKEQLAGLGEIRDMGPAIAITVGKQMSEIGSYELLDGLAKSKRIASDAEGVNNPRHTQQIPDNKLYGDLAGKYVDKSIYDQVVGGREVSDSLPVRIGRFSDAIHREWKFGKTVLRSGTHARNAVSKMFETYMDGLGDPISSFTYYKKAIDVLRAKPNDPLYPLKEWAVKNRLLTNSDIDVDVLGIAGAKDGLSLWKSLKDLAKRPLTGAPGSKQLAQVYRLADEIPRLAAFLRHMDPKVSKTGKPTMEAALAEVRRWYTDYETAFTAPISQAPAGAGSLVRAVSKAFMSYPAEATRILANAIVHKPVTLASIIGALKAGSEASRKVAGISDEDYERMKKGLPEYLRPGALIWVMGGDADNPELLDLTYHVPIGREISDFLSLITGKRSFGEVFGFGGSEVGERGTRGNYVGPFVGIAAQLWSNRNDFSGRDIDRSSGQQYENTSDAQGRRDVVAFLLDALAPGVVTDALRIKDAMEGKPRDRRGNVPNDPELAWLNLLGVKVNRQSVPLAQWNFLRTVEREMDGKINRFHTITFDKRIPYEDRVREAAELYDDLLEMLNAAREKVGMEPVGELPAQVRARIRRAEMRPDSPMRPAGTRIGIPPSEALEVWRGARGR